MVSKANQDKIWRSKTIVLTNYCLVYVMKFRCPWKPSLASKNIPKCFFIADWATVLLLKPNGGWVDFWSLRKMIASLACLLGSGLKLIFYWKNVLFILPKPSFKCVASKWLPMIIEYRIASSVNNWNFETGFLDK